jgi:hypothetical protein
MKQETINMNIITELLRQWGDKELILDKLNPNWFELKEEVDILFANLNVKLTDERSV